MNGASPTGESCLCGGVEPDMKGVDPMRKGLFLAAAMSAAVALTGFDAQAAPFAPSNLSDQGSQVIQVRQGCGLGRHRGPWGGCRWNGNPGWNACWWRPTPWGPRRVCRY